MLERSRATFKLKPKERCPGEIICTADPVNGVISRMAGETLETYCKPARCPLYYTKAGTTPLEYNGCFEAAMTMREARLGELYEEMRHYEQTFPFWAIAAYKAAERAFRTVENEYAAKTDEDGDDGDFTAGGDTDVFANLEAKMLEAKTKAEAADDFERLLEHQPELPQMLLEFMRSHPD